MSKKIYASQNKHGKPKHYRFVKAYRPITVKKILESSNAQDMRVRFLEGIMRLLEGQKSHG